MPVHTRRRAHGDRGAVTVETVTVMPLLLTLVLLLAQVTVWWHAVHIAQATASHALAATRTETATPVDGHTQAGTLLDQLGHGPLHDVRITVTRTTDRADVRITATAAPVVPFLRLPVRVHASGPVERFRPRAAP